MRVEHDQEVKSIHQKHKNVMDAKDKQFDSRFTALMSEKKT